MTKRMNKEELFELLKNLKIDKEEFWLLSSGSLVLRDIFPDAGDLDIAFTDKGLEQLKKNYNLVQKENGWFIITENIEGMCKGSKENLKYQPQKVGDYFVQNIEEYLEYLNGSLREKDKMRIPIVEEYIDNK